MGTKPSISAAPRGVCPRIDEIQLGIMRLTLSNYPAGCQLFYFKVDFHDTHARCIVQGIGLFYLGAGME